ncbi:pellino, partial [Mytilus galloprovincialis]
MDTYPVVTKEEERAVQDLHQHSVTYTLSRNQAVIVEYKHDADTDMFQFLFVILRASMDSRETQQELLFKCYPNITKNPHAYLNITGPRPFSATPTKVSHENLNSTQPRPIVAISTEESQMNINSTRSRRLASISTEEFRVNLTRTRPSSFSAT